MATFFDELRMAQVSQLSAPPTIWNSLYSTYQSKVEMELLRMEQRRMEEGWAGEESNLKQTKSEKAIRETGIVDAMQSTEKREEIVNASYEKEARSWKQLEKRCREAVRRSVELERSVVEKRVQREISSIFGIKCRGISTGGAPTSKAVHSSRPSLLIVLNGLNRR
tara:strand:- start:480 stop:977 length:498 start_codon:yes stop_codon:yes gene_type:complete